MCSKKAELFDEAGYALCKKCIDHFKKKVAIEIENVKTSKKVKPSKKVKTSKKEKVSEEIVKPSEEDMAENRKASKKKLRKLRKEAARKERKVYSTIYLLGSEKQINSQAKKAEKKTESKQKKIDRLSASIIKAQERVDKLTAKKTEAETKYAILRPISLRNKDYVKELSEAEFTLDDKKSSFGKIETYGIKEDGQRVFKVKGVWYQQVGMTLVDETRNFTAQTGKISERKMKRKILNAIQEK